VVAQKYDFEQFADEDSEMGLYGAGNEVVPVDTTRVMYEEPIERQQLMKMLDPDSQQKGKGKGKTSGKGSRKSSRVAGF
jgi:hypothetical protein